VQTDRVRCAPVHDDVLVHSRCRAARAWRE
jgi:hypothetical protein